jgi:hypothetical protein
MKQINTEIIINAPANKVWSILTDYEGHSTWNPFIKSISGEKKPGGNLKVTMQPPGGSSMTFKPVILSFDKPKEFRWKGKLLISGLFDGEHYFLIQQEGSDKTRFIQGEYFTGILTGLFGGVLGKTRQGFQLMNTALKTECEK